MFVCRLYMPLVSRCNKSGDIFNFYKDMWSTEAAILLKFCKRRNMHSRMHHGWCSIPVPWSNFPACIVLRIFAQTQATKPVSQCLWVLAGMGAGAEVDIHVERQEQPPLQALVVVAILTRHSLLCPFSHHLRKNTYRETSWFMDDQLH